ncbi:phage GP46 family protein [Ancylobacter pratisalsi]|uniref:Uncharacterized protein n=1 Tax=Ancylobacter pratisalsi TaxID=1745854 RepID=A0A6P1YPA6_9HYPH|nr:phage GP46 family protein [Ancylobacter pratisalsi]QIB34740.1 hypothetical protein G3A50_14270 [Ancylobacter pratisalsi]
MAAYFDLALVYDPATRRCDLQLAGDGDLLVDETPATPMLLAFGCDRRARRDDELPSGISELNQPVSFVERRGWAGDALDIRYRQAGSRCWLGERLKETELTRQMFVEWLKEAYAWVLAETGKPAEITVEWVRKEVLAARIVADGREITINRRVGSA